MPRRGNDAGERLAFRLTPGNVDDRQPVESFATGLDGQLFGDRGAIAQAWHDILLGQGLAWLTNLRKTRKNRVMRLWDKLLLRQRSLIAPINDPLQNISQIAHTRHRRVTGVMGHLVAGLVA